MSYSRFNWPSEMSGSIATAMLEDTAFVEEYTKKSRALLAEQYSLATRILDDAGIDYSRDGCVFLIDYSTRCYEMIVFANLA